MARLRRYKLEDRAATYHVSARVVARKGEYPLADPVHSEHLLELIEHYTSIYFCSPSSFCILGNHYHLVVHFEEPREVDRAELRHRADALYPSAAGQKEVDEWLEADWQRLNARLFDLSELMRNIQGVYAAWYNRLNDRRGAFWAGRFSSTELCDPQRQLDCMLYVELNPCRAGLVTRPEEHRHTSLHLREIGEDHWLQPLREILTPDTEPEALRDYRYRVYHRGAVPTKAGQAAIPPHILADEVARGFETSGVFRKRLRHFSEGLAIGSRTKIRELLGDLRRAGVYLRRRHPIPQLAGQHYSLREQRRARAPT
jgi:hypothetical protein